MRIFSKMILGTNTQYSNRKLTFHIEQARLGLRRIQEANHPGAGLIVPVWDFFGTLTREEAGGERYVLTAHENYLTINATGGSIIDRLGHYRYLADRKTGRGTPVCFFDIAK